MDKITVNTNYRQEFLDITSEVAHLVERSGIDCGLCHLWCNHTTAGLTINENADPDVKIDLLMALDRLIYVDWPYKHAEGNSPAHIKSTLIGCELSIPISEGRLAMGTWQGILFAEFDGPRTGRCVSVTIINSGG